MHDPSTPAPDPCPTCGAEVPPNTPGGLCTPCLVTSLLDPAVPAPPPTSNLQAPGRIPGFELLERIGEGGFGVVYAARQLHPVRRQVAIKILRHGFDHPEALARFEAERQALALMDHPGIAHVYDAGETADGQPYFVMELIDGQPITAHCAANTLTLAQKLDLFARTCDAVAHAHRRGLIHRDLKPSNVLVPSDSQPPSPKIIDFGIAKATESLLTDRTLLTRGGQVIGTPSHMSPEQAAGTGLVDTRSDIYSLGVILYELITSTPPFRAADLEGLPHDEALRKVRTGSPPRPSARIRETAPAVPVSPLLRDLDWIVLHSIENDPERRYPTADAFAADVRRCISGEAVLARPPSTTYHIAKFVRRNLTAVIAASAAAAALVAATAVSLTMYLKAGESDTRGRQRFSHSDFTQASSVVADNPAIAVAHLTRALRTDPTNPAATTLLLNTLASNDWPVRPFPPYDHGSLVRSVTFTPDGSLLLVTGDRNQLDLIDTTSGELEASVPLGGRGTQIAVSPDGKYAAVFMSENGMALVDIGTREVVTRLTGIPSHGGNTSWSADGTLLAVALDSQAVRIYDIAAAKFVNEIPTSGPFTRAHFATTGTSLLASAGDTARIYDARSGTPVSPVIRHTSGIRIARLTPDRSRVVLHGSDNLTTVRDAATAATLHRLHHGSYIESLEVSPDGGILVAGSADGAAQVWNIETGTPVGAAVPHDGIVTGICFSPDATLVATGCSIERLGSTAVRVWDTRTRSIVSAPIYHPRGAGTLAFHPRGTHVAVGSRSRLASVWQLRRFSASPRIAQHPDPVWRISFDPLTNRFLTLTTGGVARAWNPDDATLASPEPQTVGPLAVAAHASGLQHGFSHNRPSNWPRSSLGSIADCLAPQFRTGGAFAAASSPDGTVLATGTADGQVHLWSILSGDLLHTFEAGGQPVYAVAIDPDGGHVAAGGAGGNVIVWDVTSGSRTAAALPHDAPVITLTFSPDGSHLASGSADHTARILDLRTSPPSLSPPLQHSGQVAQLAFSPDAATLASSGDANAARLWHTRSGTPAAPPLTHIDIAPPHGLSLLWLPGSDRFVTTGSHDNAAHVWDPSTGRSLAKPMVLSSGTRSQALQPGGRALLTAGDVREARLWDLASAEPLTPLLYHDARVTSCAFDSSGQRLATATLAGTVFIRDFPGPSATLTEPQLRFAESLAGFRFNPDGVLEEITTPATPSPGPWFTWLADHTTTSPHSSVTTADHITALLEHGTLPWLREALLHRPADPEITSRFAQLLATNPDPTSHDASLARFLAADSPPDTTRPADTPPHLIDLAPHYTTRLDRDPLHPGTGNSLVRLAPGTHHLAGNDFDIRALIVLGSQRVRGAFPSSVTIPVDQRCSRVHFLHSAFHAVDPPGTTIGTYTLHCSDGSSSSTDLVIGDNIRGWWYKPGAEIPLDLPGAPVAWQGTNPYIGNRDITVCLHRLTIENPNPDSPVEAVTFASANAQGAPFLVALTIDPP